MTAAPFDTLRGAHRLRESAGLSQEHAEGFARTLADELSVTDLVKKADLASALRDVEQRLTIKLGGISVVTAGIVLAAIRYFSVHS